MNFLLFITKNGLVKKTPLEEYQNIRSSGLIAIKLDPEDELLAISMSDGRDEVFLATAQSKSIRFPESDIRATGRATRGVLGIRLRKNDRVVAGTTLNPLNTPSNTPNTLNTLVVTAKGFGKLTSLTEYKPQSRGGQGIYTARVTEKTGPVVDLKIVEQKTPADLLVISARGQVIRLPIAQISIQSRQTQGVRLFKLAPNDTVASLAVLEKVTP